MKISFLVRLITSVWCFNSSLLQSPRLAENGHSDLSSYRNFGPENHEETSHCVWIFVERSARFILDGTHRHCVMTVDSKISPTRCMTNCWNFLGSIRSHCNTVFESGHKMFVLTSMRRFRIILLAGLTPATAACNSSRGIDTGFKGETLDFPTTIIEQLP